MSLYMWTQRAYVENPHCDLPWEFYVCGWAAEVAFRLSELPLRLRHQPFEVLEVVWKGE